jgi:hypothetical protein
MNIKFNTDSYTPSLAINTSGKVLYANDSATKAFPSLLEEGGIFKIIDKNYIMKFSMLQRSVDIAETKSTKYPYAIVRISGSAVFKTIEMEFIKITEKSEAETAAEKKMFEYFDNISADLTTKKINVYNLLENVSSRIKSIKGFSYKDINIDCNQKIEFLCEVNKITAMIITVIFTLNEINFVDPVSIKALINNAELVLKFSVPHRFKTLPLGNTDICTLFPGVSARIMFLHALCEEMNAQISINLLSENLIISCNVPPVSNKIVKVYADMSIYKTENTIDSIINALNIYKK